MISVLFQGKPFNITVIQVYAPTINAKEVEWFYEDLLEWTPKKGCPFHHRELECKSGKSIDLWITGKFGLTVHNELLQGLLAKANGVSPREYTGQSKHPLSTTQEMTLHMNIIRWSVSKSDWLYYLQLKMEKLYIDSKDKTGCWLPFRSWAPYCKIQAYIEESKKNHWAIQVWPK